MHLLGEGHEVRRRDEGGLEVLHDSAHDSWRARTPCVRTQRRHVQARDLGQPCQSLVARKPPGLSERSHEVQHNLLTVANGEGVDEVGQRLGVQRARSSSHHQRMAGVAINSQEGHAAEFEHVQQVGVGQLILQREPQHVELT